MTSDSDIPMWTTLWGVALGSFLIPHLDTWHSRTSCHLKSESPPRHPTLVGAQWSSWCLPVLKNCTNILRSGSKFHTRQTILVPYPEPGSHRPMIIDCFMWPEQEDATGLISPKSHTCLERDFTRGTSSTGFKHEKKRDSTSFSSTRQKLYPQLGLCMLHAEVCLEVRRACLETSNYDHFIA